MPFGHSTINVTPIRTTREDTSGLGFASALAVNVGGVRAHHYVRWVAQTLLMTQPLRARRLSSVQRCKSRSFETAKPAVGGDSYVILDSRFHSDKGQKGRPEQPLTA